MMPPRIALSAIIAIVVLRLRRWLWIGFVWRFRAGTDCYS